MGLNHALKSSGLLAAALPSGYSLPHRRFGIGASLDRHE